MRILLITLIAASLFVLGCTGSSPQQTNPSQPQGNAQPQQTQQNSQPIQNIIGDILPPPQLNPQQICDKIKDSDTKNLCLGYANTDANACGMIATPSNRKDSCYRFVAIEKQQPELCSNIDPVKNADSHQMCLALASNDITLCDATLPIGWGGVKDQCRGAFAGFKQNASICSTVSDSRDGCYNQVAMAKQDASSCDKMNDQQGRNSCYAHVAELNGDSSICQKISESVVCATYSDPAACEKVSKETEQGACIAVAQRDYTRCPNSGFCTLYVTIMKQDYAKCTTDDCYLFMVSMKISKPYE